MKAVILAGGFGTRISEESHLKPKPMIEIGDKPILWHIMKMYSKCGINDFIICAGYKQHIIKEYFSNYGLYNSDITFDFKNDRTIIETNTSEPWVVTVADTGLNTMTGGRIKRIEKYLDDEPFCLTYGDGVSDVPLDKVVKFHNENDKIVTITAVRPEGRFGILDLDGNNVSAFREKSKQDTGWINGGFMVLDKKIFDYLNGGDEMVFEQEPLFNVTRDRQVNAYKHDGFWQCMDTLRDKEKLQRLWDSGKAPWKTW